MAYRVLTVDDSAAMRAFVRRVIAVEVLRREWVDLVLSDINMPGMDGEEFLRRLEADEVYRTLPVVNISTDLNSHGIERTLSLGARGYVTKPFSPEALRAQLQLTLGVPRV